MVTEELIIDGALSESLRGEIESKLTENDVFPHLRIESQCSNGTSEPRILVELDSDQARSIAILSSVDGTPTMKITLLVPLAPSSPKERIDRLLSPILTALEETAKDHGFTRSVYSPPEILSQDSSRKFREIIEQHGYKDENGILVKNLTETTREC